jgi:phosphatidylglycerophosphate synthase
MLDRHILAWQNRILAKPAVYLAQRGISANAVTILGFSIGLISAAFLYGQAYGPALVCILLNRLFDGLDGAIARATGPTDRGAFLDIALDFFFYATVPFGFALADPAANALASSALLVSFIGTGSSFLAFAIIAEKRGLSSAAFPSKGLYYLGGLTEGTETIVVFTAMCLWPDQFAAIAWLFAALAAITTLSRWWWGWRVFSAIHVQGSEMGAPSAQPPGPSAGGSNSTWY